jgi:hypothetical protein
MSFTETYIQNKLWDHFMFFVAPGADGAISENVSPGKIWQLTEIRVHASTAIASAGDLVAQLSANLDSAYNLKFFSYAMLGSEDYWFQLSQPMLFQSDDVLNISFSMASGINIVGITVSGWSVSG